MQNELEEAIRRDGLVAVFKEYHDAEEALSRIREGGDPGIDVRLIHGDQESPLLLAPREPQPPRTRVTVLGALLGAAIGVAVGVGVGMVDVFSELASFAMPLIGGALGVLVGATTGGLCFPPYRDDSIEEIHHFLKQGHTLLLALGNRAQLRRIKQVIRHAKPATLIEPS